MDPEVLFVELPTLVGTTRNNSSYSYCGLRGIRQGCLLSLKQNGVQPVMTDWAQTWKPCDLKHAFPFSVLLKKAWVSPKSLGFRIVIKERLGIVSGCRWLVEESG